MPEQLSTLQIIGYLLGSGFFGSLLTLIISKLLDNQEEKKNRKLWIFRTLLANFLNRHSYDFVSAINLVEVDFDGNNKVKAAWKSYRKTLSPRNPSPISEEEIKTFLKEIDDALAELLKVIGDDLGYKRDKLDILNNAFIPQSWSNDNSHIRKKEQLLMELLENKRALNFNILNPSPHQAASQPSATLPQGESD